MAVEKLYDPRYHKLVRQLTFNKVLREYTEIFFIGGFEYSDEKYREHLENKGPLRLALHGTPYNAQGDNVEIYLIKNGEEQFIVDLFDPVELLQPEQILSVRKLEDQPLDGLQIVQLYPAGGK